MSYKMDEITRRAFEGQYMDERDFDLQLMKKCKELVKEYDIKFNPNEIITTDDSMADDVFEAGMKLFLDLGFYCQTTRKCIKFDEWELKYELKNLPEGIIIGEGKDAVVMNIRRVEDSKPPIIHSGPTGTLCSEGDIYVKTLRSYAQERIIDSIGAGTLATIDGFKIRKGTPQEFRAARALARWARQAIIEAGRPGMHINDIAVVSPEAKICALDPYNGIRKTDGLIVAQMVELKTSLSHLSLVEHLMSYGCFIGNLMTPILGGYAGGPEGTAIVTVAEHLAGVICYNANYHYLSLTNVKNLNGTDRRGLWTISIVGQALSRNTKIMSVFDCYCAAGPGTEILLREAAAGGVAATVSGLHLMGCGSCGGKLMDHATGLEARLLKEVGVASVKMKRREVNDFLNKWLPTYEEWLDIAKAPKGKTFQELYDLGSVKPKREWMEIYEKIKRELIDFGILI
ncbi:MAG: monomethylamine:corrinoid methyltransferase [Candidatus Methanomethyliaceae archaeon]|nr:monomethylamine:corrinoid methyltransferase [Candidatus Methanomethyliaceae archaeon]MDW7971527.1 monomethylamine:corrinoid methyltransferase [Nitrososphaerota archaeon]